MIPIVLFALFYNIITQISSTSTSFIQNLNIMASIKRIVMFMSMAEFLLAAIGVIISYLLRSVQCMVCSSVVILSAVLCYIGGTVVDGRVLVVGAVMGFMTVGMYIYGLFLPFVPTYAYYPITWLTIFGVIIQGIEIIILLFMCGYTLKLRDMVTKANIRNRKVIPPVRHLSINC